MCILPCNLRPATCTLVDTLQRLGLTDATPCMTIWERRQSSQVIGQKLNWSESTMRLVAAKVITGRLDRWSHAKYSSLFTRSVRMSFFLKQSRADRYRLELKVEQWSVTCNLPGNSIRLAAVTSGGGELGIIARDTQSRHKTPVRPSRYDSKLHVE